MSTASTGKKRSYSAPVVSIAAEQEREPKGKLNFMPVEYLRSGISYAPS